MTSPLCVMRCDCEECGDKKPAISIIKKWAIRLLEASQEEDWHERRHAEKEAS